MCGRYAFQFFEDFVDRYDIQDAIDLTSTYNAAPGMNMPVVTRNSPNKVEIMKWGLIPPWAKDIRIGFKMINARAESITEKRTYSKPFKSQRCLVPFTAFYEWKKEGKDKTPYLFHDLKHKYLSFAGLYEIAHDADGKEIKSFTIITTPANKSMHGIHERMPVILDKADEDIWLDKSTSQEDLMKLLDGYESKSFEVYQVSDQVNSAQNQSVDLLSPV